MLLISPETHDCWMATSGSKPAAIYPDLAGLTAPQLPLIFVFFGASSRLWYSVNLKFEKLTSANSKETVVQVGLCGSN